jgi:hypothetical protein
LSVSWPPPQRAISQCWRRASLDEAGDWQRESRVLGSRNEQALRSLQRGCQGFDESALFSRGAI